MARRRRRLLQQRDEQAFSALVADHQHRVYGLAARLLSDEAEAEDVAQEVFVAAFKHIDEFRGESRLSTWLYRITVNLCHNRRRHRQRRGYGVTESLAEASGEPSADSPEARVDGATAQRPSDPETALLANESERRVRAAIERLDEEQRVVLVLRDVEELSYQEIAVITGLAEGTVKSRLHRARAALKALWSAQAKESS